MKTTYIAVVPCVAGQNHTEPEEIRPLAHPEMSIDKFSWVILTCEECLRIAHVPSQ